MPSVLSYLMVGAAVALVTNLITPVIQQLAERGGVVAQPDDRMVHATPTPLLGGVAMLAGLVVGVLVAWASGNFKAVFEDPTEMIGVLLAAGVITAVGVVDDIRVISAPAKMAGMVLAGSVLSLAGVSLLVLRVPFFGLTLLSADLSALLTVLWVIAIANAVNFIDGLDGLATGIVGIASATFFLYALRLTDAGVLFDGNPGALLAIIVFGMCLGFLPHNVHPARIFMGDGGALLLGVMMAAATVSVGGRTETPFSGQAFFFFAPIFIPLIILGVPLIDMAFAIVRRARRRQGLAEADVGHVHHRLLRLGHGHWRAVAILWTWTALLSGFVLYPTYTGDGNAIVPFGVAALGLVLFTVFHPGIRRQRSEPGER